MSNHIPRGLLTKTFYTLDDHQATCCHKWWQTQWSLSFLLPWKQNKLSWGVLGKKQFFMCNVYSDRGNEHEWNMFTFWKHLWTTSHGAWKAALTNLLRICKHCTDNFFVQPCCLRIMTGGYWPWSVWSNGKANFWSDPSNQWSWKGGHPFPVGTNWSIQFPEILVERKAPLSSISSLYQQPQASRQANAIPTLFF